VSIGHLAELHLLYSWRGKDFMEQPLLIHIHVPKCAGTTVEKHFAQQLGERFWVPRKRTRRLPLSLFRRKYRAGLPEHPDQIKAVSGHFIGKSVEGLFPNRRIVRSIILRQPESMMMSYYNFRMMRYLLEGQHAYSFLLFLRATRVNPMAHFLLERWLELPWIELIRLSEERKIELLDEALAEVDYVADIRQADSLIEKVSAELDIRPVAPRRNAAEEKQVKTGWKILKLEDLTPSEHALLKSRTALDDYLWKRWVQKDQKAFDRRDQSNFAYSEFVRPRYQVERRIARRFGSPLVSST